MLGFTFGGGDETARINDIIRSSRASIDARDIEYVKELVDERRGITGYSAYCEDVRRAYIGDQESRIRQQLAMRYSRSHGSMPVVPVGVIRETAEISAQAYREPPKRSLVVDGEPLDPRESPRARAFDRLIHIAQLDQMLAEAERVASTGLYAAFLRMHWSTDADSYGTQRPIIRVFWPHHVWALTSTEATDRVSSSTVLIAKIGSTRQGIAESKTDTLEVWTRELVDGTARITYRQMTGEGRVILEPRIYEGDDLPWASISTVPPNGALYPAPARDILATQDQINVAMSDGWYRHSLQSHKQLFVSGLSSKDGRSLAYGPDVVMTTDQPGVSAQMLDMQGSIDWHALIERQLLLHGRTEGQPADAWYTKPGNPETGVSREIRNIYSLQRRREHQHLLAYEEETSILPLLARIADTFGDLDETIDGDDVEYRCEFAARPERIEDEVAKTTRVAMMLDKGIISRDEAREILGLAPDEHDDDVEPIVDDASTSAVAELAAPVVDGAEVAVDDVQATALNGAQVTALVGIAAQVATGILPRESAIAIARASFPAVSPSTIEAIFAPIEVVSTPQAQAQTTSQASIADANVDDESETE